MHMNFVNREPQKETAENLLNITRDHLLVFKNIFLTDSSIALGIVKIKWTILAKREPDMGVFYFLNKGSFSCSFHDVLKILLHW